jgi:hypothetical protein
MYLFLWNALHVPGGSSAQHQELKTVYTASGTCQASFATCRYRGTVATAVPLIRYGTLTRNPRFLIPWQCKLTCNYKLLKLWNFCPYQINIGKILWRFDSEYSRVCYNEWCYNGRKLQRTVFIKKSGCYNERGGILSAVVARACAWRVGPSCPD